MPGPTGPIRPPLPCPPAKPSGATLDPPAVLAGLPPPVTGISYCGHLTFPRHTAGLPEAGLRPSRGARQASASGGRAIPLRSMGPKQESDRPDRGSRASLRGRPSMGVRKLRTGREDLAECSGTPGRKPRSIPLIGYGEVHPTTTAMNDATTRADESFRVEANRSAFLGAGPVASDGEGRVEGGPERTVRVVRRGARMQGSQRTQGFARAASPGLGRPVS
jgi:hypothetical protein